MPLGARRRGKIAGLTQRRQGAGAFRLCCDQPALRLLFFLFSSLFFSFFSVWTRSRIPLSVIIVLYSTATAGNY